MHASASVRVCTPVCGVGVSACECTSPARRMVSTEVTPQQSRRRVNYRQPHDHTRSHTRLHINTVTATHTCVYILIWYVRNIHTDLSIYNSQSLDNKYSQYTWFAVKQLNISGKLLIFGSETIKYFRKVINPLNGTISYRATIIGKCYNA